MKTLSFWKKSIYSAVLFFGTLVVLSIGYSLVGNLSLGDKVGSGSGLTASSWNKIVDGILDLDTRVISIAGKIWTLTAGQWCTSDGTKVICTTNAPVGGLGVGQTWQDMTSSRALNTTYTNSTGKPIMVYVTFMCGAWVVSSLYATVGGVAIGAGSNAGTGGGAGFINFIVPVGATYLLQQNTAITATLSNWVELR